MNKEVIEFPYRIKREYLGKDIPISDFRIHYYFYKNYLEKDVYRCYSNQRENDKAIGYIFSVERLHSDNVVMSNVKNQSNFEAYMDAAREVFFNSEKHFVEKYFRELNLDEESDKVRIDDILKYKAFLKLNKDEFTNETSFEDFKTKYEFPLVIFIEDVQDAEKNQFNSEHMKVLMMLEHHYFPINDTNEFYASQKYLEFSNCEFISQNDEDEPIDSELKTRIIKSISGDIDDNSLKLMMEVLPEFYYQSFNSEYVKFSVLYQYIEIFINFLADKMLEKVMNEREEKNLIKLKSEINEILTEKYRIKKLFMEHSSVLQQINTDEFYDIYINILKNTQLFDERQESQNNSQNTFSHLYRLRNILYHNLRVFRDRSALDHELKRLNIAFEKIIVEFLTTFRVNSDET
jgi:hypothetical protein